MEKVVLSGHIIVPLADRDAFKEALAEHIELTRNEPGCLTFEVDEDGEQLGKFEVFEVFVDQAAFDAHQERSAVSAWAEASKSAERHYNIQEE